MSVKSVLMSFWKIWMYFWATVMPVLIGIPLLYGLIFSADLPPEIDKCLDSGGFWNYETEICDPTNRYLPPD